MLSNVRWTTVIIYLKALGFFSRWFFRSYDSLFLCVYIHTVRCWAYEYRPDDLMCLMKKAGNCCFCYYLWLPVCCERMCVWLFSILNSIDVIALPLCLNSSFIPFKAQLKVSTIPFCSSIKSLLYRVCALLLYLAFLFYFFIKLHALYSIHGVCFYKQLCSIDRSIDRMICIWFWRLPFTIYIVTFAHTLHWNHQRFFICILSWMKMRENIFVHDLEFFHNGITITIWKSFCVVMRVCILSLVNTLCTFEFISCCVLSFRFAWN